MNKDVIEQVKAINEETKRIGEEIAHKVNQDEQLKDWFQKWCYGVQLFEKRGDEVMEMQQRLRLKGHDVKINMQSYELSYYGDIKEGE